MINSHNLYLGHHICATNLYDKANIIPLIQSSQSKVTSASGWRLLQPHDKGRDHHRHGSSARRRLTRDVSEELRIGRKRDAPRATSAVLPQLAAGVRC